MNSLFLYGPPGCGKSTTGRILAANLELPFFDLDDEIEKETGKPVWQIFADESETGFRRRETGMLQKLSSGKPAVIALGGGTLLNPGNRKMAETTGQVIVLDAPLAVIHTRLKEDPNQRPLLAGELEKKLKSLLEVRSEHYISFPHRVETGKMTAEHAAWQVQILLGRFHIRGIGTIGTSAYDVITQPAAISSIGQEMAARNLAGPAVIVTDDHVGPLYADIVLRSLQQNGIPAQIVQIRAGEEFKTIQTVADLWKSFLSNQLDRQSTVIALGGGVVSDLAGFAAATYLRGIPWVCLPTTLLSMADASLGGKTGADLPEGKNLIGAFHAPSLVLADPDVLSTLPERELRGGLAEVIKHGVISDRLLFDACRGLTGLSVEEIRQKPLAAVIRRAMAVKIKVIEQDPFEKGIRAILNAGHTIGHAVELATDYTVSHGEGVSIGLVVEARMAEELGVARSGLADEISAVLTGVGLPAVMPAGLDRDMVEAAIFRDKKRSGSGVKFALPVEIGQARYGLCLTLDDLRRNHAFNFCFTRT